MRALAPDMKRLAEIDYMAIATAPGSGKSMTSYGRSQYEHHL